MSDGPDAGAAKARKKVLADIEYFRGVIATADVVYAGRDTEYVPDGPIARDGHPNVEGDDGE